MGFLLAFFISAIADWVAVGLKRSRLRYVTKPAALIFLIAWFTVLSHWEGNLLWFGLGLVFSLLGDIVLLLRARYFLLGLLAFLVAHGFYIIGFNSEPLIADWRIILSVIMVGVVIWIIYPRVIGRLRRRVQNRRLFIPMLLYAATILLMLLSALSTISRPAWQSSSVILASAGAILFVLSDSVLATGRFLRPVPKGDLIVMVSYHLGQLGIAAAALLAFRL